MRLMDHKKLSESISIFDTIWDESLFVGYLTSQQHASVSHGWICSDNVTCCHTETEVAGQTFHLT